MTKNKKRIGTTKSIKSINFTPIKYSKEVQSHLGSPNSKGVWVVWGNSANGKTSYCLQLAREFSRLGYKVAYNSLEEGISLTLQQAIKRIDFGEDKVYLWPGLGYEEIVDKLSKRRSPQVLFIDSLQYLSLTKKQFQFLIKTFPNKLFVFISHAEGKNPEGRIGKFMRYAADVKVYVEGYRASGVSRSGGGKPYIIWEEGYKEYWG